jgi:hypothetical protein
MLKVHFNSKVIGASLLTDIMCFLLVTQVWTKLGVTTDQVDRWVENLRKVRLFAARCSFACSHLFAKHSSDC